MRAQQVLLIAERPPSPLAFLCDLRILLQTFNQNTDHGSMLTMLNNHVARGHVMFLL